MTAVTPGPRRARRAGLHRGRARHGARLLRRGAHGRLHPSPVAYRSMYHGGIMHGGQLLGDSFRNTPADYFSPGSGYGRVFRSLREMQPKKPLKVGVIGLGAGVIGGWMQPGDSLVFYEISPRVVDIAQARVHLPVGHRGAHRARDGRRPAVARARAAARLRRPGHRRLLGRLDPDAPGDARGDGDLREAHQARRRDRVPGHQPLHRPAAGGEAPRHRVRHGGGQRLRLARRRRRGRSTGTPRPTRSSSRATSSCSTTR